jgi:hypothetical protein
MARLSDGMGKGRKTIPGYTAADFTGPTDEGFIRRKAAHDRRSPRCRGSYALHRGLRAFGSDYCYCCGDKF